MTRGEKILVVWLLCMGFILGYGVCLGIHRHQAGQDFQRGRMQGWKESSVIYECGNEQIVPFNTKIAGYGEVGGFGWTHSTVRPQQLMTPTSELEGRRVVGPQQPPPKSSYPAGGGNTK